MKGKPGTVPEVDPQVEALLMKLGPMPRRDAQRAAAARDAFLAESGQITPRVSNLPQERHDKWKGTFGSFWFARRRENRKMFNLVMTVLLALGVVFGGGATTVAVAQGAQPSDALYAVKTWSEDVRLGMEADPQAKFGLALQFAARRAEEVQHMLAAGGIAPTALLSRFENQAQQALRIAAGMPNDQAMPALERLRNQVRLQEQTMAQLQLQDPVADQTRARVQTMLQTQERLVQEGIDNPDQLREQLRLRQRDQLKSGAPAEEATDTQDSTLAETPVPGLQNPWTDGIPTPGSSYGPGPGTGDCADCTGQPNRQGSGNQGGNGGSKQP